MDQLTGRQEAFAQAVCRGSTASDAYRTAYRPKAMKAKSVHEKASHLIQTGKVRARVEELREIVLEKVVREVAIDKAWITRQLIHIVERARADGKLNAAVRALELLGKDQGMFVDRRINLPADPLDGLTTDELRQFLGALGDSRRNGSVTLSLPTGVSQR